MDVIPVANRIERKISELVDARKGLAALARKKAMTAGAYAKKLAVVVVQLRNGQKLTINGHTITDPPVSIIEKLAKGVCSEEQIAMDLAEAQYKMAVEQLDCIRAELNGYQSINRHLDVNS